MEIVDIINLLANFKIEIYKILARDNELVTNSVSDIIRSVLQGCVAENIRSKISAEKDLKLNKAEWTAVAESYYCIMHGLLHENLRTKKFSRLQDLEAFMNLSHQFSGVSILLADITKKSLQDPDFSPFILPWPANDYVQSELLKNVDTNSMVETFANILIQQGSQDRHSDILISILETLQDREDLTDIHLTRIIESLFEPSGELILPEAADTPRARIFFSFLPIIDKYKMNGLERTLEELLISRNFSKILIWYRCESPLRNIFLSFSAEQRLDLFIKHLQIYSRHERSGDNTYQISQKAKDDFNTHVGEIFETAFANGSYQPAQLSNLFRNALSYDNLKEKTAQLLRSIIQEKYKDGDFEYVVRLIKQVNYNRQEDLQDFLDCLLADIPYDAISIYSALFEHRLFAKLFMDELFAFAKATILHQIFLDKEHKDNQLAELLHACDKDLLIRLLQDPEVSQAIFAEKVYSAEFIKRKHYVSTKSRVRDDSVSVALLEQHDYSLVEILDLLTHDPEKYSDAVFAKILEKIAKIFANSATPITTPIRHKLNQVIRDFPRNYNTKKQFLALLDVMFPVIYMSNGLQDLIGFDEAWNNLAPNALFLEHCCGQKQICDAFVDALLSQDDNTLVKILPQLGKQHGSKLLKQEARLRKRIKKSDVLIAVSLQINHNEEFSIGLIKSLKPSSSINFNKLYTYLLNYQPNLATALEKHQKSMVSGIKDSDMHAAVRCILAAPIAFYSSQESIRALFAYDDPTIVNSDFRTPLFYALIGDNQYHDLCLDALSLEEVYDCARYFDGDANNKVEDIVIEKVRRDISAGTMRGNMQNLLLPTLARLWDDSTQQQTLFQILLFDKQITPLLSAEFIKKLFFEFIVGEPSAAMQAEASSLPRVANETLLHLLAHSCLSLSMWVAIMTDEVICDRDILVEIVKALILNRYDEDGEAKAINEDNLMALTSGMERRFSVYIEALFIILMQLKEDKPKSKLTFFERSEPQDHRDCINMLINYLNKFITKDAAFHVISKEDISPIAKCYLLKKIVAKKDFFIAINVMHFLYNNPELHNMVIWQMLSSFADISTIFNNLASERTPAEQLIKVKISALITLNDNGLARLKEISKYRRWLLLCLAMPTSYHGITNDEKIQIAAYLNQQEQISVDEFACIIQEDHQDQTQDYLSRIFPKTAFDRNSCLGLLSAGKVLTKAGVNILVIHLIELSDAKNFSGFIAEMDKLSDHNNSQLRFMFYQGYHAWQSTSEQPELRVIPTQQYKAFLSLAEHIKQSNVDFSHPQNAISHSGVTYVSEEWVSALEKCMALIQGPKKESIQSPSSVMATDIDLTTPLDDSIQHELQQLLGHHEVPYEVPFLVS